MNYSGLATALGLFGLTPESFSMFDGVSNLIDPEMPNFLAYLAKYDKTYPSKDQFVMRFELYKESMETINNFNARETETHTLEANKFADWTKDEKDGLSRYDISLDKNSLQDGQVFYAESSTPVPESINWNELGAVTGIKD